MEFKGNIIKGTEHIPGHVFIADTADDTAQIYVPEANDLFAKYADDYYEEADAARYAVYDSGLDSYSDGIAIEFLLDNSMRSDYEVDDLFEELSVLCGEEPRGVNLDDVKKLVELAKERILQELNVGKFALKIVSSEYLEKAEDYFGNITECGGVYADMLIAKIEQLLTNMIADKYRQEINQIQTDSIRYGKDTSLALAKDRNFRGNYYTARKLYDTGRITAIEFDRLIDDEVLQIPEEILNRA